MSSDKQHLFEILRSFRCGMLITEDRQQKIISRPMAIADVTQDGEVLLITAADSEKVKEVEERSSVNFSCQEGSSKFLSISGKARVEDNPELLQELWSPQFQAWFPEGPQASSALLLRIVPQFGEYWDSSGLAKAKYAYQATKAYISGTTPAIEEEQHAKVSL